MSRSALAQQERSLTAEVVGAIADVPEAEWNALVDDDDPFTEHAFLRLLEDSGSVGQRTGWYPQHLLLRDARDVLVGAVPLYLKDNSYGEYIFDWGWADAAISADVPYYPKLVAAVPFTPVTGRRLLVRDGPQRAAIEAALLAAIEELVDRLGLSSAHLLFVTAAEREALDARPRFLPRLTYQFRWDNSGYESFEHYLATFRSPARKSVRRERRRAESTGLQLQTLEGPQLRDEQWDALYPFYRDTTGRKWGQRYLTRAFFQLLRERLADRVVVTLASDGECPVAGALSFRKGSCLYGRYWGSLGDHDSLHFELCYYRPLELCIERGYRRFEAGAQGHHKLKRGLVPQPTFSAHLLQHPGLRHAVARHLVHERHAVEQEMDALAAQSPFRRS